jgi:hypothetical protein
MTKREQQAVDRMLATGRVAEFRDERRPGEAFEEGNGLWAYLKPGWKADDTHACHEYSVADLAKAVKWAEPCECSECKRRAAR